MLEFERHQLILRFLSARSVMSVPDLADLLDASGVTIRRDINALAARGLIRRIRGGAESLLPRHDSQLAGIPFGLSSGMSSAEKRAIARTAAALIRDGSSIVLGGGTTTHALVEFLTDRQLDILTHSISILTALLSTSRNRVTLPGGAIYRERNVILSPFERDTSEHYWGEQLFLGCHGINHSGLMDPDPQIVRSHRKLLKRTESLIVMADSRKLRQRSSMIVVGLERVATLVTDDGARPEELEPFRKRGINVIVAEVLAEDRSHDSGPRQQSSAAQG